MSKVQKNLPGAVAIVPPELQQVLATVAQRTAGK
eukprot:CAMPEP_0203902684 /NCGR_PEP_ID=MMETSP0359-20131031/44742_1 /ASSEMBLY_ACC=CAM_ASM_000338 /TAXON_ID=268821 /ORGANISM="Scrippsiella Hangoei, Strain SHTV-5" /LENGTH=33 /DNA_ID= /DNA_START= /DNA_END= /DNA_ORIENTATION=